MTWHAAAAFLVCARIGAIHSVVFAGFSAESLRDHVNDCASTVFTTSDEGRRGGKVIATKAIVDKALEECPAVRHCLVLKCTGGKVVWDEGCDQWWYEEVAKLLLMASEEPLFVLYTSGSTGKPKGIVHTMGGYLLCAALTVKYVFDVHKGNRFAYMADAGWITGHTCVPFLSLVHHLRSLLNGVSTVMFETTPPHWETVAVHGITHFYSVLTAVRLLRSPSVRIPVFFSYTPCHPCSLLCPRPPCICLRPRPVRGFISALVRVHKSLSPPCTPHRPHPHPPHSFLHSPPHSLHPAFLPLPPLHALTPLPPQELEGHPVEGVLALKTPWPSILLTTEIESALIMHKGVAKTAVIGIADELTGQAVYVFVMLKPCMVRARKWGGVERRHDGGAVSGKASVQPRQGCERASLIPSRGCRQ
ncbi:hypothetical protein B0H17DRAFT_1269444 [Mycena rosella]|uniref:acetate--CoA ligase n=1 Tax=Mycena rosella TaxID=1033263 RepID=A0AAD7DRX9_MYCRO|nr:hypothetical protein B0H17DRAFT_1269444 [Mycena rosella]